MPDGADLTETSVPAVDPEAPTEVHDGSLLRFGRGIGDGPALPAPAAAAPAPAAQPRRKRRGGSFGLGFLFGLVVAGVIVYLLSQAAPAVHVVGATVDPTSTSKSPCDAVVDVVGTVHTNGRSGAIKYQWLRSDGEQTPVLTQSVADGADTTTVHLLWTLSGKGTYPASATLRVLDPDPLEATGKFTYSCN